MKKAVLTIFCIFFFLNQTNALDIENNLDYLDKNISDLEEQMNLYENSRLNKTYPIGSIYETTTYSTVEQIKNALGGTWDVYGSGRILIGVNTSDINFNTVNKMDGKSSITLAVSNLPSHTHQIPALSSETVSAAGSHSHSITAFYEQSGYNITIPAGAHYFKVGHLGWTGSTSLTDKHKMMGITVPTAGAHTHSVTTNESTTGSTGSGTAFTNMQPSIAVYRYKRVS